MLDTIKREAIVWRDDLCLGDEKIDKQHESLFLKAMELYRAATSTGEDRKQKCVEIILFLKDYAIQHFADEEAYRNQSAIKTLKCTKEFTMNSKKM